MKSYVIPVSNNNNVVLYSISVSFRIKNTKIYKPTFILKKLL